MVQAIQRHEKITEYDVLRVILTLLVIIGHCNLIAYESVYGGFPYPEAVTKSYNLITYINQSIDVFYMPLFMALSGALFYRTIAERKYGNLSDLMKDKAKRVLVPFVCVCVAYEFPMKCITGYYSCNLFKGLLFGELLVQGATHLWFLPTLFIIFLIVGILEMYLPGYRKAKCIVFAIAYLISIALPSIQPSLLAMTMKMTLWFYMGYLFEPNRKRMGGGKRSLLTTWGAFVILSILKHFIRSKMIEDLTMKPIMILIACYAVFVTSRYIAKTKVIESKLYKMILKNSFGIYLYGDTLNYAALAIGYKWIGSSLSTSEILSSGLCLIRFFITLFGAMFINIVVQKLKGRFTGRPLTGKAQ